MTRHTRRTTLGLSGLLAIAVPMSAAAGEPEDVLIEVRYREPFQPSGPPPSPPWAGETDPSGRLLPTRAIPVPEVRADGNGFVVFQSALFPANERQLAFLAARHLCTVEGPVLDPRFENRRSCVVRIHSNPRLLGDVPHTADCALPDDGGNIHGLRRDLDFYAATGVSKGAGVLIVVVDVPLNARHIEGWNGAKFDPQYSYSNDGVQPGQGVKATHGTMAAYLATVLAPKATLASISTAPYERRRLDGAIVGLSHVVWRFTSAESGRYQGVVVNNSWAVGDETYQRVTPCGPGLGVVLSASPCHVFNRLLRDLAHDPLRFDFVFAAGNSGQCELTDDQGSIRGPARHADVTTVAAVDAMRRRLFDSSQGGLSASKPDVSAYTHYTASGTIRMDTQTSGATAVTSGLVAAVRSCLGHGASTADVRRIVTGAVNKDVRRSSSASTAQPTTLVTHDREFGTGVILPVEALRMACETRRRAHSDPSAATSSEECQCPNAPQ